MENVRIPVCAIIGLRFILKGQLLSFGGNVLVGLNDPCVVTQRWVQTHSHRAGGARFKCRFWIVSLWLEQERGSFFSSRCFLYMKIARKHVSQLRFYA